MSSSSDSIAGVSAVAEAGSVEEPATGAAAGVAASSGGMSASELSSKGIAGCSEESTPAMVTSPSFAGAAGGESVADDGPAALGPAAPAARFGKVGPRGQESVSRGSEQVEKNQIGRPRMMCELHVAYVLLGYPAERRCLAGREGPVRLHLECSN